MKHITMSDIAEKLGISRSTVSRALKDHPLISASTKKQVKKIAKEFNYEPNFIAQSLKQSKALIIGVIVPDFKYEFFSHAISGIEEVAYNAGYTIILCQSDEKFEREVINTNSLIRQRVAGIIASVSMNTKSGGHFQGAIDRGIPVVFFDRVCDDITANKIVIDDTKCAFNAVEHLIGRGYKNIAHLAGPKIMDICKKRLDGYTKAMKKNNMPLFEGSIMFGGLDQKDGYNSMDALLKHDNIPDAIFAVNSPVAIGAYLRIKKAGLKIPSDIGIVGFSNNEITTLVDPPMTIVDQPSFEMGRKAADILLNLIETEKKYIKPEKVILDADLIIRESS